VLKPRNCVASIQLSFGKKGLKLIRKRKRNLGSPNSNFVSSKLCSHGHKLEEGMSTDAHFVRSMYMAIKPPITYSPQSSFPPSSRVSFTSPSPNEETISSNPSNIDVNTRVSYDDCSNVYIEIESYNISSLRASINSYLRLADASYRCIVDGDSE
jgi:tRNA threonylcarbamoyladenosine modification (KEOPS) complex  Pcc1 subunit